MNLAYIIDFLKRHIPLLVICTAALLLVRPEIAEFRTLLLILAVETVALSLSGLAAYAYTKIDFTKDANSMNLGLIFLGVHVCIGFIVLGVYIAQF